MKILSLDLDYRNVGIALRKDQVLATQLLSTQGDDVVGRLMQVRDHLHYLAGSFNPDLVVIEDAIADFTTSKTAAAHKAALHAMVLAQLREVRQAGADCSYSIPVVRLPVVWFRSYVSPHRYKGKEQNAVFGKKRGFPPRLLKENERSKRVPRPLLYEHELDAAIWGTIVQETILWAKGRQQLTVSEARIAAKIKERLERCLPDLSKL